MYYRSGTNVTRGRPAPTLLHMHMLHMHMYDVISINRQWRSSSFQEFKKVRVSRDLWLWPWPWAHPGCRLTFTWWPSCASLVAIRPFACEKKRFAQKFTDGQTDKRRTPRHCISSFLEWAKNQTLSVNAYLFSRIKITPKFIPIRFETTEPQAF